jgi:hypothetical protein
MGIKKQEFNADFECFEKVGKKSRKENYKGRETGVLDFNRPLTIFE